MARTYRALVFSDLHLSEATASTVFMEVFPGLTQAIKDLKVTDVVFLGDWWELRYRVDVRLLNRCVRELREWTEADPKLEVHLLPGNHDMVGTSGEHALRVFGLIPGVTVYDRVQENSKGWWAPWGADLSQLPKSGTVLWAHMDVVGALMNDTYVSGTGVAAEAFVQWGHVFTGHYHKRQTVGANIYYVGSPYQISAAESGQLKGFMLWDGKVATRVEMRWGPRYFRVHVKEPLTAQDLECVQKNDVMHVQADPSVDLPQLQSQLDALGVRYSIQVATPKTETARMELPTGVGLLPLARAYLDHTVQDAARRTRLWVELDKALGGLTDAHRADAAP